jgi:hypothetical protein
MANRLLGRRVSHRAEQQEGISRLRGLTDSRLIGSDAILPFNRKSQIR